MKIPWGKTRVPLLLVHEVMMVAKSYGRLCPQKCPHHAPNIISQFWLTEEIYNKPTSNLWDYKNQKHEVMIILLMIRAAPPPLQFNFLCTFLTKQAMWTNMGQETFFLGWFRNNLTWVSSLCSTSLTKPQLTLVVQQGDAASITLSCLMIFFRGPVEVFFFKYFLKISTSNNKKNTKKKTNLKVKRFKIMVEPYWQMGFE